MTIKANGTHAKEIALHFINLTNGRATPQIMKKTVSQAKSLLTSGYTKEEIVSVIDFLIITKKLDIFSLGYINASINDALREIAKTKEIEEKEKAKEAIRQQIESQQASIRSEVAKDDESTKRNREKARRIGVQSRFGKKFDFDMFEGQRQDN